MNHAVNHRAVGLGIQHPVGAIVEHQPGQVLAVAGGAGIEAFGRGRNGCPAAALIRSIAAAAGRQGSDGKHAECATDSVFPIHLSPDSM
ncbi:hypothetical protein D3C86_1887720 [compost metagenome]